MPDNKDKQQKRQPLPSKGYSTFKQRFNAESDIYKGKSNQQVAYGQAELIYYAQKLNQELRKKDPKNFDALIKEYGYNEQNPMGPQARIAGAEKYINKEEGRNFDKSLSVEEQKRVLGKSWDRYVQLKKVYGQGLNLVGKNEKSDDPSTWQVGARHAVAPNPWSGMSSLIKDEKNNVLGDYSRMVIYDPSQPNPYLITDVSNLQEEPQYVKRIVKVVPRFDMSKVKKTPSGNVWKNEETVFDIYYDDDSKETTKDKNKYYNFLGLGDAPENIKRVIEADKVDISKLTQEEQDARLRAASRQDLAEEL